ncbi:MULTISPECIES: citramalate synthase [Streptomyces]|uniref:Citramalate synthase n=1 Tax=Streptomyces tendae TaxID=1932 RepID=A0ABW7SB09_STRTE|nr:MULTISPECIES: citramalate synthase [unclassified Streptomyces]MBQ0968616.1 citramalate synthase [Streptomyces sp. RK74B]MBQ1008711.1 citramalate synthase [Streptomyces sp. RK23]MZG15420.1 citramalate synthase [Streptomyces sp. SID5914]
MGTQDFQFYDTTLRDGTQQEGLVLSVDDKLAVARCLDRLGVGFVEGGWPGAVPKDTEFFRRAATELSLANAVLVAFGATRRPGTSASADPQVRALLTAGTEVVTLVAKSHPRHVELALRTTLAENLAAIGSTVRHLVHAGRRVFLDAEHFFDGHRANRDYALEVVRTAAEAGAETVVLCDTNGGSLPDEVGEVVADTLRSTGVPLGIHCHDDCGCAVANTMAAVASGARHVQGTVHGYGERCGNANLLTLAANLILKCGVPALPPGRLDDLAAVGRAVAEITGRSPAAGAPYVGRSAFTHKGGLHASALRVDSHLYQHIDPADVGNAMRTLVSDMGGRSSVLLKARELGYDVATAPEAVARLATKVKELEHRGHSFESADASFELLLREELSANHGVPSVDVLLRRVETRADCGNLPRSSASVRLRVNGVQAEGDGSGDSPVDALDRAVHQALDPCFPRLQRLRLAEYQVRLPAGGSGGRATARVLASFTDGRARLNTVGVDGDTDAAFFHALLDAVRYVLTPVGRPGGEVRASRQESAATAH